MMFSGSHSIEVSGHATDGALAAIAAQNSGIVHGGMDTEIQNQSIPNMVQSEQHTR